MIYVMSDILGKADRFHAMLNLIQFSSDDTLYIIGDVIDQHTSSLDLVKETMEPPNIITLSSDNRTA